MRDLGEPLSAKLRELVSGGSYGDDNLKNLVNSVIDETTDFEHVITFLDNAPSRRHRQFAEEMRNAFEQVLRDKLDLIREETQEEPIELYKVLLDIYNIDQFHESLQGMITINYDEYIEKAIEEVYDSSVDFGIQVGWPSQPTESPRLLKLHGSFGWQDTWPISRGQEDSGATLWIPPGIQKAKEAYPFNVLWGLAREMLACDVLRVVGCRLGPNDWDLISLLFSMRHVSSAFHPQIEVIDAPMNVRDLKKSYPYLEPLSILEVEPIGSQLITELTGRPAQRFQDFAEEEQEEILQSAGFRRNWFELWLTQNVEQISTEVETVSTDKGFVEQFLNA